MDYSKVCIDNLAGAYLCNKNQAKNSFTASQTKIWPENQQLGNNLGSGRETRKWSKDYYLARLGRDGTNSAHEKIGLTD